MPRASSSTGVVRGRIWPGLIRVAVVVTCVACSSDLPGASDEVSVPPSSGESIGSPTTAATSVAPTAPTSSVPSEMGELVVRGDVPGRRIDRRLLGTNVPAWLGPTTLTDPAFHEAVRGSGATLLRMPGGSWSNTYNWAACELGDPDLCFFSSAARPIDFAQLLRSTALPGIWTVSVNATAQSAAAAVAFFNGSVGDDRVIGVDRDGFDWGTVDQWAQLRADHGLRDPVPIKLWEVGNEVYGGKPEAGGAECAPFGWEDVWTCDGSTYVTGDVRHDGFLDIRAAMLAIDPTIEVGAVGVADPESWSNWGNEVISLAGDDLDFYIVHQYGFDQSPDDEEAVSRAGQLWPEVVARVRSALPVDVPIAVTEYNLVAVEAGDTEHAMTHAVNALFVAETIGQLADGGVSIANQWNLANGVTPSGTDYGLVDAVDYSPYPQYHAFALWARTGDTLLNLEGEVPDGVRIYPTRHETGARSILMINLGETSSSIQLDIVGHSAGPATVSTARAERLDADEMVLDGPRPVAASAGGRYTVTLPAWSISVLDVAADA